MSGLPLVALPAGQRCAEPSRAPFGRQDPGAHLPRRRVANVLRMAACELGDPILFQVLAKADDALLAHMRCSMEGRAGSRLEDTSTLFWVRPARPDPSGRPKAGMRLERACVPRKTRRAH